MADVFILLDTEIDLRPFVISEPTQIGVSGGRTSGFMLKLALAANGGALPSIAYPTFQNTGLEDELTLVFIRNFTEYWGVPIQWMEYDGTFERGHSWKFVTFETASRTGEPFRKMYEYYKAYRAQKGLPPVLPNPTNRMCTDRLKIKAATWYMRDVIGLNRWDAMVGIRHDEPKRYHRMMAANEAGGQRWENVLPLYESRVTKETVGRFWQSQPFDLGMDGDYGNCVHCHLKSQEKVMRCIRDKPKNLDFLIWLEQDSGQTFRIDRPAYKTMQWVVEQQNKQIPLDLGEEDPGELIDCMCGD